MAASKKSVRMVEVDPLNPSDKVVREIVDVFKQGGVVAFPTDTLYGIGCAFGRPRAIERIFAMRRIDGTKRPLTFLLPDLGEVARYADVSDTGYRILKRIFPGAYCVELSASPSLPAPAAAPPATRRRRTIGVRVPDSPVCEKVLWGVGLPILTATAKSLAGQTLTTAAAIADEYGSALDLVVDGGTLAGLPSTVVSLVDDWVTVLREGKGPSDKVRMG